MAPPGDETSRLHRGGRPGAWGNLGLWAEGDDYAGAGAALARTVGQAAGLQPGERVLSVACGRGEELGLWVTPFGAGSVVGVEPDAHARADAQARAAALVGAVQVLRGTGTSLHTLGLPAQGFDRVLCVDAAYHLHPRRAFLDGAFALLRPGGTLAYTDLVLDVGRTGAARRLALPLLARACGVRADDLLDAPGQRQRLHDAGFEAVQQQGLDAPVLDGFARFVARQSAAQGWSLRTPGWRRVAITARLIPAARALGLGYTLLCARRPGAGVASAPSTDAATAKAERTALSSSGTPGSA